MGREQIAMEHYRGLVEGTERGPTRDCFRYRADNKTMHTTVLEKAYFEVVRSNGVRRKANAGRAE
jgi:hypothetical protein